MIKHPKFNPNPIKMLPRGDNAAEEAALQQQRRRVSALKAQERGLHDLREHELSLEVERIAAEVALRALTPRAQRKLTPGKANEIIQALDHVHSLETTLRTWHGGSSKDRQKTAAEAQERLQIGLQALLSWLEAPDLRDLQRTRRAVRAVLLAITFAAIGAALTFHPAFLLLLFPVGPMLILLRSGQDIEWRRIGAKRRFKETSLDGPMEWTEPAIRSRIRELRAAIVRLAPPSREGEPSSTSDDIEGAALSLLLADEKQHLARLLVENELELDDLHGDLEQQLRLLAAVERSQSDLLEAQEAIKAATVESNEVREELFAYLARRGAAPPDGHADTTALAEGLDRLIATRHRKN